MLQPQNTSEKLEFLCSQIRFFSFVFFFSLISLFVSLWIFLLFLITTSLLSKVAVFYPYLGVVIYCKKKLP